MLQPYLWTPTVISPSSRIKHLKMLSKHLDLSMNLNALYQQTMSISNTIMLTMEDLRSLRLLMTSTAKDKLYHSVEWVLTTKAEWLKGASDTNRTAPGQCLLMPTKDGPTPSVSTCGHMHYAMPQTSETPPPIRRESGHLLQPLPRLKENPNSLHFILLAAQSTF